MAARIGYHQGSHGMEYLERIRKRAGIEHFKHVYENKQRWDMNKTYKFNAYCVDLLDSTWYISLGSFKEETGDFYYVYKIETKNPENDIKTLDSLQVSQIEQQFRDYIAVQGKMKDNDYVYDSIQAAGGNVDTRTLYCLPCAIQT